MVQPAPLMMSAPVRKSADVPSTAVGAATGTAIAPARNVLNRHGKNR